MSDHERDERDERVTPKTEPSDYRDMMDDHNPYGTNGGLMDQRTPTFPGALLGLQGKSTTVRVILISHYAR